MEDVVEELNQQELHQIDHIYAERIRGIVLEEILETELLLLIGVQSSANLQGIAHNLEPESVQDALQLMNAEILALAEDVERMEALQENLSDIIPRVMSLTWIITLNRIQLTLQEITSAIPVENGVFINSKNIDLSSLITYSANLREKELDSEDDLTSPAVYDNITCLEQAFQLLEGFENQLMSVSTKAREMNKILLKCISSIISRVTKGKMASG